MSLNKYSAIKYNKNRNYSQQAIGIIQNFVKAPTSGKFDEKTVQAIYDMQKSPLYGFKFTPDGKVGPNTLGFIIMELDYLARKNESAILRNYSYSIQGQNGEVNPIVSFKHWNVQPLQLRTTGTSSFSVWGVFSVHIVFSGVDPTRYEYRQRIKGVGWDKKPEQNWTNLKDSFDIPGSPNLNFKGLWDKWKEDGQGNKRFGHRDQPPTYAQGICDKYLSSTEYLLQDTFGIAENTDYVSGRQIDLSLDYAGCIIDKQKPVDPNNNYFPYAEIYSKEWSYKYAVTLP